MEGCVNCKILPILLLHGFHHIILHQKQFSQKQAKESGITHGKVQQAEE